MEFLGALGFIAKSSLWIWERAEEPKIYIKQTKKECNSMISEILDFQKNE
jgi:hypothetical protein